MTIEKKLYNPLENCLEPFNGQSNKTWTEKSYAQQAFEIVSNPLEKGYREIGQAIIWMIENRGGLAKVVGQLILPAQILSANNPLSNFIINRYLEKGLRNAKIEKILIPHGDSSIEGVICYPKDWKKEDNSRCILYHNPNAVSLTDFFYNNELCWTAGKIFESTNCPIILYDYRGVGLNQDATSHPLFRFRATYESIIADGQAALVYALNHFQNVEVFGTSLGGGVATAALDRYLTRAPKDTNRITQLVNHDSFTTTTRVVFPSLRRVGDSLGYALGAKVDAITPMKNLIDRGVTVTILYHTQDPVIPLGARMGDFVQTLPKSENIRILSSPEDEHASISAEMLEFTKKASKHRN